MKEEDVNHAVAMFFETAGRLLDSGVAVEDINAGLQDTAKMMQQIVLTETLRGLAEETPPTK